MSTASADQPASRSDKAAVLITGGSGFIGLNLVETLLERGERVIVFGPEPQNLPSFGAEAAGAYTFTAGDVRDREGVRRALEDAGADRIIHAAAITAGAASEARQFAAVVDVNVAGTVSALEAARLAGVHRFLFLSSVAVYGRNGFAPGALDETDTPPAPQGLYAITKHAAEQLSLRYGATHGMSVIAARVGAPFGRWERSTGVRDTLSAIHQVTALALAGREAVLPSAGRKDWIYAPDIAAALALLLDIPEPREAVYNVGPGGEWTLEEWCRLLAERHPGFRYCIAERPQDANVNLYGNDGRSPMAIARLRAETGFAPRFGLQAAFADYMQWIERYGL